MKPFFNATALITQPEALRKRMMQDGYLYLKGIMPASKLAEIRLDFTTICADEGWLKPGSESNQAICWTSPKVEGEEEYNQVYDRIQRLESLHSLPHSNELIKLMTDILGGSCFPHPLSVARLAFPYNEEWATPPHQDYPNNQGTKELYACWIPLGDCPVQLGSLKVLEGSHALGLLPLQYSLGAGHRQAVPNEQSEQLEWVGNDFEAGDILIFHSLTLHQSNPNSTDKIRLSVDYRFQREGDALTEGVLKSHFGRQTWDEIYIDWHTKGLQYYWKDKKFKVVPWNKALHQLPDDHMDEALKQKIRYDRKREAIAGKFNSDRV